MKLIVPNMYVEYGRYIDKLRAIPFHIDCLKPVERRLLVSLNRTAGLKFAKSAKVVGHCIGNYHPHGDLSTYGALVTLVSRNFVIGKGNFGIQGFEDSNAAAMRYTEVKMSPYIKDSSFSLIKYVPWEPIELDPEPIYLPSIIPLGLIGGGLTQGVAFHTTKMPRYDYISLLKRLHCLLTNADPEPLTPVIPGCDVVGVDSGSFEQILSTGIGSVWVCPKYTIHSTAIDIFGKNPINGFSKLKKVCLEYPDIINADDLGGEQLCVRAYSLKGPVTHEFTATVIDTVTVKINFICNVVMDDGRIETKSIDSLLVDSFTAWKAAWLGQMNEKLAGLNRKLRQLEIIKVIRECYNPAQRSVSDIVVEFKKNSSKYAGISVSDLSDAISKGKIKELIEAHLDFAAVRKSITAQEQEIRNIENTALNTLESMIK